MSFMLIIVSLIGSVVRWDGDGDGDGEKLEQGERSGKTRRVRMIGVRKGMEGDMKGFIGLMNAQHCEEKLYFE